MKRSGLLIGISVASLLILGGIAGFVFWGWGLFVDQARVALNGNPVILQHVGEVSRIALDFDATGNAEGASVFVFRVEGSKGTGVVSAEFLTVDAETEEIRSGTLQLASGESYDLMAPDQPAVAAPAEPVPDAPAPAAIQETPAAAAETATETPVPAPAPAAAMETPAPAEVAAAPAEAAPAAPIDGGELYAQICAVCHRAGLNAAPKYGNKILWGRVTAKGREQVYTNSIKGIRAMPPRGGIATLSDAEVRAAVDYMVNGSGGWGSAPP